MVPGVPPDSLVYSTYLGGTGWDSGYGISVVDGEAGYPEWWCQAVGYQYGPISYKKPEHKD